MKGEGIVVAEIDTGTQWDHPASSRITAAGTGRPPTTTTTGTTLTTRARWCLIDTDGHGTHVMGTMVGDDGGDNQIGMAPGAQVDLL